MRQNKHTNAHHHPPNGTSVHTTREYQEGPADGFLIVSNEPVTEKP